MSKKPLNLLFLCMGSTCRSPMMAALYARAATAAGRNDLAIAAGWAAVDGDMPSAGAIAAMSKLGVDISGHRARLMSRSLVKNADYIIAADRSAVDAINKNYPEWVKKVIPLGLFSNKNEVPEIRDPAGKEQAIYDWTARQINSFVSRLVDYLNGLDIVPGAPSIVSGREAIDATENKKPGDFESMASEMIKTIANDPKFSEEMEIAFQEGEKLTEDFLKWMADHPQEYMDLKDRACGFIGSVQTAKFGSPKKVYSFVNMVDASIIGFAAGYWYAKKEGNDGMGDSSGSR